MRCPVCQADTKVTNSRNADHDRAIKRRRWCTSCGRRFTTYERLELLGIEVVKRNGSKEPFSRHKLESGIRKALEKRPCTEEQLQKVLSHLKQFDKVAYLRFASVYRNFRSPQAFEKEIKKLQKSSS